MGIWINGVDVTKSPFGVKWNGRIGDLFKIGDNPMSVEESKEPRCKHCGKVISWTENFGWVHGILGGGWNTTCYDGEGETTAEPEIN